MSYKFKAIAPIIHKSTGNRENDIREILEKLTAELEHAIRQNPEQYLWAHRRWKIKAPTANQL
jgi:lauroyl/myristoyl acyltransferase